MVRRALWWVCVASYIGAGTAAQAQDSERLNRFKAVFMYSFVDYLSWPSPEGEQAGDFTIGILGDSPLEALLGEIAKKRRAGGRRLRVVAYADLGQLGPCEMLFVTPEFAKHLEDLKKKLGSSNVLTVSDSPGLAKRGVAINFVVVDGKLKFEINTVTLRRAGLQASSQLLKLATLIPESDAATETP